MPGAIELQSLYEKARIIYRQLGPEIDELEKKRRGHLLSFPFFFIISWALLIIPVMLVILRVTEMPQIAIPASVPVSLVIALVFVSVVFDNDYRSRCKTLIKYKLSAALRFRYKPADVMYPSSIFDHYLFLPNYLKVDDGFSGKIGPYRISIYDVRYRRMNWGVIIHIELKKHLKHHTVMLPGKSAASYLARLPEGYTKINIGPGPLGKEYAILSNDHLRSFVIFDPAFHERMAAIAKAFKATWFCASFEGTSLLLAARTRKNSFELGGLLNTITEFSFLDFLVQLDELEKLAALLEINPYTGIGRQGTRFS
jgi:hypothetical protein